MSLPRRVTGWRLGLVMCAALLGSCSQPTEEERPSRSARVAPAPTFANGGDCPAVERAGVPPGAGCVTELSFGDATFVVYAVAGADARPGSWRMRLIVSEEVVVDRRLRGGTVTAYPRVVAVADVNRDGHEDWWVKTHDYASHGAPWGGLTLFVGREGDVAVLRHRGQPLTINFGGISRLGEGARCHDGDLVLLRAEATDRRNRTWATTERRFALDGATATLMSRERGALRIGGYNDPDLDRYYEVDCYGTRFGVFADAP